MNRRSFFKRLVLGASAFTILPGAGRVWKAVRTIERPKLVPFWYETSRLARCTSDEYEAAIRKFMGSMTHAPSDVVLTPSDINRLFCGPPRGTSLVDLVESVNGNAKSG